MVIAALYLLTADRILWKQASRFVNGSHIDFEHIKAVNNSTDSYALLCVAKDFCLGTKHMSSDIPIKSLAHTWLFQI